MARRQTILSQGSYGASTSTRQANVVPGSMGDASGLINVGNAMSQTGVNATKLAKQKRDQRDREAKQKQDELDKENKKRQDQLDKEAKQREDQIDSEVKAKAELMVRSSAGQTRIEWDSIKDTLEPGEQMAEWNRISDKHYASLQDSLKEISDKDPDRAERLFGKDTVFIENKWAETTSGQWEEAGILDVTTKRAEHVVTVVANAQDSIQVNNESPNELIAEFRARVENDTLLLGTLERKEYFTATSSTLLSKLSLMENTFPGSVTSEDIKSLAGNTYDEVVSKNRTISSKVADPWSPSPIPAYREAPSPYSVTNSANATYSVKTKVKGEKSFALLSPDQLIKLNEIRGKSGKRQASNITKNQIAFSTEAKSQGNGGETYTQFSDRVALVKGNPFIPDEDKKLIVADAHVARVYGNLVDLTKSTAYLEMVGGMGKVMSMTASLETQEDMVAFLEENATGSSRWYKELPPGHRDEYLNLTKNRMKEYVEAANSLDFNDLFFANPDNARSMEGFAGQDLVNKIVTRAEEMGVDATKIAAVTPEQEKVFTDLIEAKDFNTLNSQITHSLGDVSTAMVMREVSRALFANTDQPDDITGGFGVLGALIHNNNNLSLIPHANMILNFAVMGEAGEHYAKTELGNYGPSEYNVIREITGSYPGRTNQIDSAIKGFSEKGKEALFFVGSQQTIGKLIQTFEEPNKVMQWVDRAAAAYNYQTRARSPADGYSAVFKLLSGSIVSTPLGGLNSRDTRQHPLPNYIAQKDPTYWTNVENGTAASSEQVATWIQGTSDALFIHLEAGRGSLASAAVGINNLQPDIFTPGSTEFEFSPQLGSNMVSQYLSIPQSWRKINFGDLLVNGMHNLVDDEILDLEGMPKEQRDFFNAQVGSDPWSRSVAIIKKHGAMIHDKRNDTMNLYIRSGSGRMGADGSNKPAGPLLQITDNKGKPISIPFSEYIDYIERYNADQTPFQRSTFANLSGGLWDLIQLNDLGRLTGSVEGPEREYVDNKFLMQPDTLDLPPRLSSPVGRALKKIDNPMDNARAGGF